MRSCTSPAGRLESHQRGFGIETPFQMQKTKALDWVFSRECQKSGKAGRFLFLEGGCSGNSRVESWGLISLAIRALPHDLVTGGIPHAGSRQSLAAYTPWGHKELNTTEPSTWIYAETTSPRVGAFTQSKILLKITNSTSILCVEVWTWRGIIVPSKFLIWPAPSKMLLFKI